MFEAPFAVSPLALLLVGVLALLALPALWMLCAVALDLPVLGATIAAACGAAIYVMRPHAGITLVDATIAVTALAGGAILVASATGTVRRLARRTRPIDLPVARVVRD